MGKSLFFTGKSIDDTYENTKEETMSTNTLEALIEQLPEEKSLVPLLPKLEEMSEEQLMEYFKIENTDEDFGKVSYISREQAEKTRKELEKYAID